MPRAIDDKTRLLYLQNPEFCPKCESKNIMRADLAMVQGRITREVWCRVCTASWKEYYSITDIVVESDT